MAKGPAIPFETFDSVFDALAGTLAEAAGMQARFELLSALEAQIQSWQMTPQAAANRLGITRVRLGDISRGKLSKFSLDELLALTTAAAPVQDVSI